MNAPGADMTWDAIWQQRMAARLRQLGFASVTAFAQANPGIPLQRLTDILGADRFAQVQLHDELLRESEQQGRLRDCAKDLLIRFLRAVPGGWPKERSWAEQTPVRGELTDWQVQFPEPLHTRASAIVDALLEHEGIPSGWAPNTTEDPIIADVFDHIWPAHGSEKLKATSMPTDVRTPWTEDWEHRLRQRLRALGYASTTHFAEARPLESFETLVKILGEGAFAPAQLYGEMLREAEADGRLRGCATALLLRAVRSIPGGWPATSPMGDAEATIALAQWGARLPQQCQAAAMRVLDALVARSFAPPQWAPESVSDPVLVALFESYWDEGES